MRLLVEKKVVEEVEIEVQFPLYLSFTYVGDYGDGRQTWTRIEPDGRVFSITEVRHGVSRTMPADWEVDYERIDLKDSLHHYLEEGSDWRQSSQKIFHAALEVLCKRLAMEQAVGLSLNQLEREAPLKG